jgi:hypothetical protein
MKSVFARSNLRVLLSVLAAIVLVLLALSHNAAPRASAAEALAAPGPMYWYQCDGPATSNHIGLFTNRVHIYCPSTTPVGGAPALSSSIHWFAFPTAPDSAAASRFMSLLQTSVLTSRPVWVQVDPTDTSGSSFGCGSGDCRRIYGMEMR